MGTMVPNWNCFGTNSCISMVLKRQLSLWKSGKGAWKKCSAWRDESSHDFPIFMLYTESMIVSSVILWLEQEQFTWPTIVFWYCSSNLCFNWSTRPWSFGWDTLTKCDLNEFTIPSFDVTPFTTGCKSDWDLLYSLFQDFQNSEVLLETKELWSLSQLAWFGFFFANLMACLYAARIRRRSSLVGPKRGFPSSSHIRCMSILLVLRKVSSSVHQCYCTPGLWRGRTLSASLIILVRLSYSAWIEETQLLFLQCAVLHVVATLVCCWISIKSWLA